MAKIFFNSELHKKVTFLLSDRAGCDVNRCADNKIYQPIITTSHNSCCHQWRHINEEPLDTVTESSQILKSMQQKNAVRILTAQLYVEASPMSLTRHIGLILCTQRLLIQQMRYMLSLFLIIQLQEVSICITY